MAKSTSKMSFGKGKRQYHIACSKGDLSSYVLMPGNPDRLDKITQTWAKKKQIASNREYCSATGYFKSTRISCLSAGIGAPSAAIAVEEAARIGVHTFIRVGSSGAVQKEIKPGEMIISTAGVRLEGTSKDYVRTEYPAYAHYEVVLALIQACEKLNLKYHLGVTASTDSFYIGEGGSGFKGYSQSDHQRILSDLQKARVINVEMESSALFTIASLYNLRAGSICVVVNNLVTHEFRVVGEKKLGLAASEAVAILARWDALKKKKRKKYFFPSLIRK